MSHFPYIYISLNGGVRYRSDEVLTFQITEGAADEGEFKVKSGIARFCKKR